MNDPACSAIEQQIHEHEAWLRQYEETRGERPAADLERVKDRTRGAIVNSPESGNSLPPPAPELIARIKARVRAELAALPADEAERFSRTRTPRRVGRLIPAGLAAAAAIAIVAWIGNLQTRPAATAAPDVSRLSDFVIVLEHAVDAAENVESAERSTATAEGSGIIPQDTWFEGEVQALDDDIDRLLSDAWIDDDLG